MRYLSSLTFWITFVTCVFDTDPLYGFSQNEAAQRCEQRLNSIEIEGPRLSGPYQLVFLQGIQDIKKMLGELRTTSNLTSVYRLSSECHSALRSMEWLVNKYGNPNQTIISPTHQSSSVIKPEINQKAIPAPIKNISSQKDIAKKQKKLTLKKAVIKKKKTKRAGKLLKA